MRLRASQYQSHLGGNLRLMRHYPEEAICAPFFRTNAKLPNEIAPNYRTKTRQITEFSELNGFPNHV